MAKKVKGKDEYIQKVIEKGLFEVNFTLYYLGSEEYMNRFKMQVQEKINSKVLSFYYYDLEYQTFAMSFVYKEWNFIPGEEGEIAKEFIELIREFADGSDEALCFFFGIEYFCSVDNLSNELAPLFGYGYEEYDFEGDCGLSKIVFKIPTEIDTIEDMIVATDDVYTDRVASVYDKWIERMSEYAPENLEEDIRKYNFRSHWRTLDWEKNINQWKKGIYSGNQMSFLLDFLLKSYKKIIDTK